MSRRKAKGDDLDDMLGDLLGEDDAPSKKVLPSRNKQRQGRGEDFYSSLAAAADEVSDVSDADPDELAGTLGDLDALDAALFGPPKPSGSTSSKPTTPLKASAQGRMEADQKNPKSIIKSKRKTVDFDEDDPLGDLLSDEEQDKPKPKSVLKKSPVTTAEPKPVSPAKQEETARARIDSTERPPTRSGNNEKEEGQRKPARRKKDDDIMFDDDDVLGGMGLDSPRRTSAKSKASEDQPREGGAKSIMDDLLGKASVSKHIEKPNAGDKRDFAFQTKTAATPKKTAPTDDEDDFQFGSYMPTAAESGAGSRPSSHRSVRFEDDDLFSDKPRTAGSAGGRRRGAGASYLDEFINKDDRDWLDIACDTPADKKNGNGTEERRPWSAGTVLDKERSKAGSAPEAVDWLGLSRLGSPDTTPRIPDPETPPPAKSGIKKEAPNRGQDDLLPSPTKAKQATPEKVLPKGERGLSKEDDDWLVTPSTSKQSPTPADTQPQQKATAKKDDDWLVTPSTSKQSPTPADTQPQQKATAQKDDDWLGLGTSPKTAPGSDDPFGLKDTGGDYLGLGEDIDPDTIGVNRPTKNANDIFSTPPSKDPLSKSLPWEMDQPRGRRERGSNRPRGGGGSAGREAASSQGASTSLADSPRGLSATLEALGRMDPDQHPAHARRGAAAAAAESSQSFAQNMGNRGEMMPPPRQRQEQSPQRRDTSQPSPAPLGTATASPMAGTSVGSPGATRTGDFPHTSSTMTSPLQHQQQMQQHQFQMQQSQAAAELKRQEDLLQQQQMMMMRQQQQQQADMQRQIQTQQDQLRQQHEQQMAALAQQQQQTLNTPQQAFQTHPTFQPAGFGYGAQFGSLSLGMASGNLYEDPFAKIHRLESEKLHLMSLMETAKTQHQEEAKLREESYQKRLDMMEESYQKKEQRLREENSVLSAESLERLKQLEQEKAMLMTSQLRKQDEWETEKNREVSRLKDLHRAGIDEVMQEHREALERVKKAKNHEVEAAVSAGDHSRTLRSVMDKMDDHVRDLGDLQDKVDGKHLHDLGERESAARDRGAQLKVLQDHLERQQHDNEVERARLQGLVTKLEVQLTEQSRHMEEEKWRMKQEEVKLKSHQIALEKERQLLMEQVERDKIEVEKSKTQLLEEQRSILGHLAAERHALAEEKAQFHVANRLKVDQELKETTRSRKGEVELEMSLRLVNDEKSRLAMEFRELELDKERLRGDREQLDQDRRLFQMEKTKLEQLALQVKQRSQDIEDMCTTAAEAREEGDQALVLARKLEAEQTQRMQQLQAQLTALRSKEKQIAEERLSLAKDKAAAAVTSHGPAVCVSCRTPMRDTGGRLPAAILPTPAAGSMSPLKMSPAARTLFASLGPEAQPQLDGLSGVSHAIEIDRSVRMWKIASEKDKHFLEDESFFMQALKNTPYHSMNSSSPLHATQSS